MVVHSSDAKRAVLRNLSEMHPEDREEVLRSIVTQAPDDDSLDRMSRALVTEMTKRSKARVQQSRESSYPG